MKYRTKLLMVAAAVLSWTASSFAAPPSATTSPVADAPPVARVDQFDNAPLIKTARSGNWSDIGTWEGGKVTAAGDEVLIHGGHRVVYDVDSDQPIRYIHVAGTLSFAPDRDTKLNVGLLVVRAGEEEVAAQDLVNLMHHGQGSDGKPAALVVGSEDLPIVANHHAIIRLTYLPGMDKNVCPAIIDSGARMDFHGAVLSHTWTKLKTQASAGDLTVTLSEVVTGWRPGDRIIVTTTITPKFFTKNGVVPSVKSDSQTEQRIIKSIDGQVITLDRPLGFDHLDDGPDNHAEVANLSRNVIVESSDPDGVRGHTMYHHGSTGSISYAEFRHLGKEGELGRYALHFHLCGDTMRGCSIVGASIWDSANRWITIHGTNFMVVRDCVGYQSIGHGFFLEDGTEEYNVFDHNLAVQALHGQKLPQQILAFDNNDGAGFWWANSLNTFIGNDAVECDQYGYRFEAGKSPAFNSTLNVRQPDGTRSAEDIRTLPFIRFENNEAHSQRRFALNLGGYRIVAGIDAYYNKGAAGGDYAKGETIPSQVYVGDVDGFGPDNHHPFIVKNFRAWATQWGYHSSSPSVIIDGLDFYDVNYGIWRSRSDSQLYKNLSMKKMNVADVFYPWAGDNSFQDVQKKFIKPIDDLPPATIITGCTRSILGSLDVTGTTEDNGVVTRVLVNGIPAKTVEPNFGTWEVEVPDSKGGDTILTATATDDAGNVEKTPHTVTYTEPQEMTAADAQPAADQQDLAVAVAKMEPAAWAATQSVNQHVYGTVTFSATQTGVQFVADINGLEPGTSHVFHIHDNPDVSSVDLLSAGKQWKPKIVTPTTQSTAHLSTLGVLVADASGHAHLERTIDGLSVSEGPDGIINHTVIIHQLGGGGKAGPRIAGGVIKFVAAGR